MPLKGKPHRDTSRFRWYRRDRMIAWAEWVRCASLRGCFSHLPHKTSGAHERSETSQSIMSNSLHTQCWRPLLYILNFSSAKGNFPEFLSDSTHASRWVSYVYYCPSIWSWQWKKLGNGRVEKSTGTTYHRYMFWRESLSEEGATLSQYQPEW